MQCLYFNLLHQLAIKVCQLSLHMQHLSNIDIQLEQI